MSNIKKKEEILNKAIENSSGSSHLKIEQLRRWLGIEKAIEDTRITASIPTILITILTVLDVFGIVFAEIIHGLSFEIWILLSVAVGNSLTIGYLVMIILKMLRG